MVIASGSMREYKYMPRKPGKKVTGAEILPTLPGGRGHFAPPPSEDQINCICDAIVAQGSLIKACEVLGISANGVYRRSKRDQRLAEALEAARELKVLKAEEELYRRAVHGDEEPVFDRNGNQTGTKVRRSDVLLIFLLKGEMPLKYRDNPQVQVSVGSNGLVRSAAELPEAEILEMLQDAAATREPIELIDSPARPPELIDSGQEETEAS